MQGIKPIKKFVSRARDLRDGHRARPAPMRVWIRHRIPALNVAVRGLLRAVPHDEAPDRNPFK